MTSKKDILDYVAFRKEARGNIEGDEPIYCIYLITNPDEERIYEKEGERIRSGFPDTGPTDEPGYYHDLDSAIKAMNENACDIREYCYNAGFILCRFAGMYDCVCRDARMYFLWDDEKEGFFQAEEPQIFAHVAF